MFNLFDDAKEKLAGQYAIDRHSIDSFAERAFETAYGMLYESSVLAGGKEGGLHDLLDIHKAQIRAILEGRDPPSDKGLLIGFGEAAEIDAARMGESAARLCEMGRLLGLPIPKGFVMTPEATALLLAKRSEHVAREGADETDDRDLRALSGLVAEEISRMGEDGAPERLLLWASLREDEGDVEYFSVSCLPVARKVLEASRNVVSAVLSRREATADLPRPAVTVVAAAAKPRARGVVLTLDPAAPAADSMVFQVAADGREDSFTVTRHPPFEADAEGRCGERQPPECASAALSVEDVTRLAGWSLSVERYFNEPQQIEWVKRDGGRLVVTRIERLRLNAFEEAERERLSSVMGRYKKVFDKEGRVACPGIAGGPLYAAPREEDLSSCPDLAVLVVASLGTDIEFIRAMRRVSALIAEKGSPTDHAASLARQFHLPTIVGVEDALRRLGPFPYVTVDADEGTVYEGLCDPLIRRQLTRHSRYESDSEYQLLSAVVSRLTAPSPGGSSGERIFSLGDIVLMAQERAMAAMCDRRTSFLDLLAQNAQPVEAALPIDLRVLDVDPSSRALFVRGDERRAEERALRSPPLLSLIEGLGGQEGPGGQSKGKKRIPLPLALAVTSEERLELRMENPLGCFLLAGRVSAGEGENYLFLRFEEGEGFGGKWCDIVTSDLEALGFNSGASGENERSALLWSREPSRRGIEARMRRAGRFLGLMAALGEPVTSAGDA